MQKNKALLDIVAPMNVEVERNFLTVGENYTQVYGIIKYPQKTKFGWASNLTNIIGTICTISFEPIDNSEFVSYLGKNIIMQRGIMNETTNDPAEQLRAKIAIESSERILEDIEVKGEQVGLVSTTIMATANEKKLLQNIARKIKINSTLVGCKNRLLSFGQKEAFNHMSFSYGKSKNVSQMLDRVMAVSSLISGFPHANSGYTDDKGYYLAKDINGGLVVIDLWKRSNDRTNSNLVILGIPGSGKSTALKHIILNELMLGTKVIIIDPEREYKDLCIACNGDWINAAGGRGKINPLEINEIKENLVIDDENNNVEYTDNINDLALYIKHLEVFFSLYLDDVTDIQLSILKDSLIELYEKFGITWETKVKDLNPSDYPVMSDFYNYLVEKSKSLASENNNSSEEYYKLSLLLKDMAMGSDSFLWNGHTTLNSDSQLIVLDTFDLQGSTEKIKRTEYFVLTTWMWSQLSKDRNEKVFCMFDEAYLLIDPRVPQTLYFLKNASKRCRKYEGALAIISHSVIDFLDPSVKMHGQALLDLPTYKLIFGTDGENLRQIKSLYSLNNSEEDLLLSKRRGDALFFVGSKRMHIDFQIPEYEKYYMGAAGGR